MRTLTGESDCTQTRVPLDRNVSSRASSGRPAKRRDGFTLVELLVALALIVLILSIISQAFVAGLEAFRHLKASGDMVERLRSASLALRGKIVTTNEEARDFIQTGLLTGSVDRAEASNLAAQYEEIRDEADSLQKQFREIKTDRPEVVQAIARAVGSLEGIKISASLMTDLLALINPPPPPPPMD